MLQVLADAMHRVATGQARQRQCQCHHGQSARPGTAQQCQTIEVHHGGLPKFANIDEMPFNRGGGGHGRAHEMGPATGALTPFEIAV